MSKKIKMPYVASDGSVKNIVMSAEEYETFNRIADDCQQLWIELLVENRETKTLEELNDNLDALVAI